MVSRIVQVLVFLLACSCTRAEVVLQYSRGDTPDTENLITLFCYNVSGGGVAHADLLPSAAFLLNGSVIGGNGHQGQLTYRVEPATEGIYSCAVGGVSESNKVSIAAIPKKRIPAVIVHTSPDNPVDVDLSCSYQPGAFRSLHSIRWTHTADSTASKRGYISIEEETATVAGPYAIQHDFTLHISNATSQQSGIYQCRVGTEGKTTFSYGSAIRLSVRDGRHLPGPDPLPPDDSVPSRLANSTLTISVSATVVLLITLLATVLVISLLVYRLKYHKLSSRLIPIPEYDEVCLPNDAESSCENGTAVRNPDKALVLPITDAHCSLSSSIPKEEAVEEVPVAQFDDALVSDLQKLLNEASQFLTTHYCEISYCTCSMVTYTLRLSKDALFNALNTKKGTKSPLMLRSLANRSHSTAEPKLPGQQYIPLVNKTHSRQFSSLPNLLQELQQIAATGSPKTLSLGERDTVSVSSTSDYQSYGERTSPQSKRLQPKALHNSSKHSVPFLGPLVIVHVTSEGGTFENTEHDVTIEIPPGAVRNGVTISLEVGVALYGPFELPEDYSCISPIVWVCVQQQPDFKFLKPIKVKLPHLLDLQSTHDCAEVTFLKAGHRVNANERYCFEPVDGATVIEPEDGYGTLFTDHFCYICMTTPNFSQKKKKYCVIQIKPIKTQESNWTTSFCVTYFLKTCMQAVKEQCEKTQSITIQPTCFDFSSTESPSLVINLDKYPNGRNDGWILCVQSNRKVSASDVDYSGIELADMELLHEQLMYPPRFTVEVAGSNAQSGATALVWFLGAEKELRFEFPLEPPPESVQRSAVIRSLALVPYQSYSSLAESEVHSPSRTSLNSGASSGMISQLQIPLYASSTSVAPAMVTVHQPSLPQSPMSMPRKSQSSYMANTPPDELTDIELTNVSRDILAKLAEDSCVILQSYLGILDHLMVSEVKAQETPMGRVMKMLKIWRDEYSGEWSMRDALAGCLRRSDPRLVSTAEKLSQYRFHSISQV